MRFKQVQRVNEAKKYFGVSCTLMSYSSMHCKPVWIASLTPSQTATFTGYKMTKIK